MTTYRLTTAQAIVKFLAALRVEMADGSIQPYCAGVFAIFGHGNVVGMGEALWSERATLPTYRAHNEQSMAHAAIGFAKASLRQRIMAVSSSIGPGATNMVTAAAVAHVNRIPLLLLPGDTFATRTPDPVLQQLESFQHGDESANDCFRPVTRYFDRITRPEHLLTALPRAIQVMTDPANCGPVCLALPQDVQAFAHDFPVGFFEPEVIRVRRPPADAFELRRAVALLKNAKRPLIVVGGGVLYSQANDGLLAFADMFGIPLVESHGGKSAVPWNHPLNLGAIGVDGGPAANSLARDADLVFAVGTRLQDFTTGSHALFAKAKLLSLNVQPFDAGKWSGTALVADAKVGLEQLTPALGGWRVDAAWTARAWKEAAAWVDTVTTLSCNLPTAGTLPYDAEVMGAVRDSLNDSGGDSGVHDVAVGASGGLPGEMQKIWRASRPGNYHMEYGYSCMGYEIAGALGVKLARPDQEVIVFLGDGSYMMANSEIASSVLMGKKLIVVVLDNGGFGCIERLQRATGNASFNNMLDGCIAEGGEVNKINFAMHAAAMGADAVHVKDLLELKRAMVKARTAKRTQVLVIDTTHTRTTGEGGCWWEVGIPEVSDRAEINAAFATSIVNKNGQRV